MTESVTEFSEVLHPYFPPPTYSSVRVGGLVVEIGSCDGTDSGAYKLLLNPFCLPPFSYVVKCCMKRIRPAFCLKWTYRSALRATTITTIIIQAPTVENHIRLRYAIAKFFEHPAPGGTCWYMV